MSRNRSRVYASVAAALLVSLAFVGPAAATESTGGIGRETSSSASNGKSAGHNKGVGKEKSAADRSSARTFDSKPARANSGTTGSSENKSIADAEEESSSSKAAVQHERPNDFQAQADPDGDTNGGVDQPGGEGGADPSDQDGNNGSGNDSDCEDDNRGKGVPGHCKEKPASTILAGDADLLADDADVLSEEATVLGVEAMADTAPAVVAGTQALAPAGAQVLGVEQSAAPSTGILPQTGAATPLTLLMFTGLGLATVGAVTLLARQRVRQSR